LTSSNVAAHTRGGTEPLAASPDPDVEPVLLVPDDDEVAPEISIVIPAMNEQATVEEFVRWCREGLSAAGVTGEILIVDSSTDRTAELAQNAGARVLRVPPRGLGRAYIDAIPYIRGPYVIMGDADCTYDFRDLTPFAEGFRAGNEFVMGSRWLGTIEPGAMPKLHRYLGTPVTTWILNRVFGSRFTDIHCGMRGITRDALVRMGIASQSWEYASEMVLKSVHMHLRTTEVPVTFLRDRNGRVSHHKRAGWFSPFHAAWINLQAMFIYGAEFFLYRPGMVALVLGLVATLALSTGPLTIGGLHLSLFSQLFAVTVTLVGLQSFLLGCLAQVLHDYTGAARRRWLAIFPYTRTVVLSAGLVVLGLVPLVVLLIEFLGHPHALQTDARAYLAVTGLMLVLGGFMTFTFTLVLHATAMRTRGLYGPHE
jgi:glycosyltransferase involved in cell wall biosynthesis